MAGTVSQGTASWVGVGLGGTPEAATGGKEDPAEGTTGPVPA
jgi:hypothetical protein